VTAEPASRWSAEGPLAERVLQVAQRVTTRLAREGAAVPPTRFRVLSAPREHVGLGVGTQLSLAVTRMLATLAGLPELSTVRLAELSERGLRSGIGLHGFIHGGLIVDGGHRTSGSLPPLVSHLDFPDDWSILVVLPRVAQGCHGLEELHAFAQLPAIPEQVSERLCRLVLLGLLPAVAECDLENFGASLSELQQQVGRCFAPAQGGTFAHPESEAVVAFLEAEGLRGVGQSSWGPALYGFTRASDRERTLILQRLRERFGLLDTDAFWTRASRRGAIEAVGDLETPASP
jgi:beta-ribofuranosylaminobenzene 5'-phosphate synthase